MPVPAAAPPLPVPAPLVSLVVPSRDNVAHLAKLVASAAALRRRYPALELVIVDNDSRSPTTSAFLDWSAADWLRVRSEGRRVGKEGVSSCRSRWSPSP